MTNARLARLTAAPGQGASFIAAKRGGLASILPLSLAAESRLRGYTDREATWQGDRLVEMRDFPALADTIVETGYLFERSTFPN